MSKADTTELDIYDLSGSFHLLRKYLKVIKVRRKWTKRK